jgi:uncharacterized protein YbbK (DUF523 family)
LTECFDGKSTIADHQVVQHVLTSIGSENSPSCGVQYSFKMAISSDSVKSAGEILLRFGDEIVLLTGLVEKTLILN